MVRLVVVVARDGTVRDASVESGEEPFASAAVGAVRQFRYAPAERGGVAVAARIKVEVRFSPPRPLEAVEGAGATAAASSSAAAAPRPAVAAEEDVDEVRVRGQRAEPSRSASLARAEVRQLPGAFGDPFRAVEALPGITPIVSGLPFFFVRGAPPGNVGTFLDGIRVPALFHVGVGPSVVHPALMERVDLYPGGYPARYGRYAGGIVAGETGAPAAEARGEANLRVFDAGALVETPVLGGRGAVLAGGRYSYSGLLLSRLSPDTELSYWDYQARAGLDVTPRDRVTVFSFGAYDYLGQKTATTTLTGFETEFHRLDLRHDRRFASGNLRTAVTLGLDRTRAQQDRYVDSQILGARTELETQVTRAVRFRAGTDLSFEAFSVDTGSDPLAPSAQRIADAFGTRKDFGFALRADAVVNASSRFDIIPGVRTDLFTSAGAAAVAADPRFATRLALGDATTLATAFGMVHQPPSFVIPLPGVQPGGLAGGLQRAVQESVSLERDLGFANLTFTLFHNAFFNMTDTLSTQERAPTGCPPGSLPRDTLAGDPGLAPPNTNARCGEPRFPVGRLGPDRAGGGGAGADSQGSTQAAQAFEARALGQAYGVELFVKRSLTKRLGGFVSYTLSRSTRSYGARTFVAAFDRTHVANVALGYDLGRGYRAGARTVFYTGLPAATNGDDTSRLPAFFRLDLRFEKKWQLGRKASVSAVAEWMNVTLSKEAVATRCTLNGCEAQTIGPVTIPSLGLEGAF